MSRSPDAMYHSDTDLTIVPARETNVNILQRKRKQPECEFKDALNMFSQEINKKLDDWRRDLDGAMSRISENIFTIKSDLATVSQVTSDIKKDLQSLRSDHSSLKTRVSTLDEKHQHMLLDITELKKSVEYACDQQNDLKQYIDSLNAQTPDHLSEIIQGFELKLDSLEQQARQCNVEICNLPEKRTENLVTLLQTIATQINFSLPQKDVIAIHRVPHAHNQNNKPKNVIVKLSSRILRDNFLSTFRLAKGVRTDQLGIAGNSQPIYIHEHLTLKKKQLFRECKEAARKNNFKYVWVKNATILTRETDASAAMAIRSTHDIRKIKPATNSAPVAN